jgi:flagellar basal body-associated protein FliL
MRNAILSLVSFGFLLSAYGTENLTSRANGELFSMGEFAVKVESEQGPRLLLAQVELELLNPQRKAEVFASKAAIQEAISALLAGQSYRVIRQPSSMKQLRESLLQLVNRRLSSDAVQEVHITRFHLD